MIRIYTQPTQGHQWLQQYQGRRPILACILGFTATALIPGISAAGATPDDRKYTAIADGEFLLNGVQPKPQYPLPPLTAGASPVLISRAVVEAFDLPVYLFNAGLPQSPAVPAIDLGGVPAKCLTSGNALPLDTVKHLFEQGVKWGEKLAETADEGYVIISECVVGGTTTALSILTGLGIVAAGKVNSSHPQCNHAQKWAIVQEGLRCAGLGTEEVGENPKSNIQNAKLIDPFQLVAAVGDPMQIVAAGMAIAASHHCGVLLAGGTQMLAVYALAQALSQLDASVLPSDTDLAAQSSLTKKGIGDIEQELEVSKLKVERCLENLQHSTSKHSTSQPPNLQPSPQPPSPSLKWQPERVVVGTTRWVAEDPTGDTVGLARDVGSVPLLATPLSFATSRYPQLQAYEEGYVKEGVGAGGCAIAAHLYKGWNTVQLLGTIEALVERYCPS
ncbi:nicotinate mononucleotide-dependent phosphoribosyltransferase CobT [Allocoleopsis sp.]|uniref:nicotinate mononucleotide-dependent phosphoribosyltransferase CobT n=1 Tax=Allocoleopsis sp. TaxID=3088169 RepID=UPI002FD2BA68